MARVHQIVGLDLGLRTVRAVWVELRGGKPRVTRAEKMALPIEGGDNIALTRTWLDRVGLPNRFAAIAIPGTQLVFQPGKLTPEDPRTPRQAADIELIRFNDMVGDTMACDVSDFEFVDHSRRYLMSMARPQVISDALSALVPLGVRPTDLVPAPVALYNGLAPLNPGQATPCLYIEIGGSQTELAVGTDKGMLFARSFAFGGRQFTDAIARVEGCSAQQAEMIKCRDASLPTKDSDDWEEYTPRHPSLGDASSPSNAPPYSALSPSAAPFADILTKVAERWYSSLSACLAAYRSALNGPNAVITHVVVSGGGAQLRGFPEWLQERIGLPVRPASQLPLAGPSADPAVYGLAIGLATTSLEAPGLPRVSLIPPDLRDEVVFREKKPYWIAASVTFALALGVFTAGLVYSLSRESGGLEKERAELRKRERIDKEISEIRNRTATLRKQAAPLRSLLAGGPATRVAVSLAANSIAPEDWISLICDEATYLRKEEVKNAPPIPKPVRPGFFVPGFRAAPLATVGEGPIGDSAANPAPRLSDFSVFIIEGYTPDVSLKTVDEMIRKMRSAPAVKKVDLLGDDKVQPPEALPPFLENVQLPEMRRFVIRLEISPP